MRPLGGCVEGSSPSILTIITEDKSFSNNLGRRFESYFRDQYIVIAKLDRAGGVQLSGLGSSPSQYINISP